jgi:hypothetical protein
VAGVFERWPRGRWCLLLQGCQDGDLPPQSCDIGRSQRALGRSSLDCRLVFRGGACDLFAACAARDQLPNLAQALPGQVEQQRRAVARSAQAQTHILYAALERIQAVTRQAGSRGKADTEQPWQDDTQRQGEPERQRRAALRQPEPPEQASGACRLLCDALLEPGRGAPAIALGWLKAAQGRQPPRQRALLVGQVVVLVGERPAGGKQLRCH